MKLDVRKFVGQEPFIIDFVVHVMTKQHGKVGAYALCQCARVAVGAVLTGMINDSRSLKIFSVHRSRHHRN